MGNFDVCQKRIPNVPKSSVDRTHSLGTYWDVSMEYPYHPRTHEVPGTDSSLRRNTRAT